jgi:hypothetical protein
MAMRLSVCDLRAGEPVDVSLMVTDKRLVPFRDQAKGRYLAVILVDRTGQIEGRAWENADSLAGELKSATWSRLRARSKSTGKPGSCA